MDIAAKQAIALSVVIPCYNERDGIAELHRRVTAACDAQAGSSYEIVLVIDGATDGTREAIVDLARKDIHIVAIDLARNYGHQIALSAGLELCRGERILILDADLQDPPELLGPMMAKMDEGFDVVYGQRLKRDGESLFKRTSASLFYRLLRRMVDIDIAADTGDFRLMSRRAIDHLNAMPERYRFIRGMVTWIGLKQTAFHYHRQARFAGTTHYPLRKMVLLAIDAMTSFSIAPLRFASHLGMIFGLIGLVALGYTIVAWLEGNVLPGWTSLAAIVLILGSVQLLVLGIFGEYLGRMYMETKRRPLYIVNEIVCSDVVAEGADSQVHRLRTLARGTAGA
ncbi:glycosyltransferase family 2 protein [Pararhizobium sp.]|uniref:glycosyltransferase family 2 protein n=1 Tax=Pararhizobium sp. TaxID=1977563 RepID=UPI003D0DEC2A